MFSETARQIVHMSMGVFALLLRVLTWWQAALCALAALLFNALVLPRAGGRTIIRPVDASRGYPFGILIYPVSVLLLILAFPARLDIAASAWGIMALGDGAATLAGRRWGRHRLGWNPDKSVEGLVAFIAAGGAAAVLLAWWTAVLQAAFEAQKVALGADAAPTASHRGPARRALRGLGQAGEGPRVQRARPRAGRGAPLSSAALTAAARPPSPSPSSPPRLPRPPRR